MDNKKALEEFAENSGFHFSNGRFFKRCSDGSVAIVVQQPGGDAEIVSVIDPSSWASIVSTVSHGGETGERYRAALTFHGEPQP